MELSIPKDGILCIIWNNCLFQKMELRIGKNGIVDSKIWNRLFHFHKNAFQLHLIAITQLRINM